MADPRDEIEALLNFLLPFAEQMLKQEGEFYPYAAVMADDGELAAVAPDIASDDAGGDGAGPQPDVGDLLVALHAELGERASEGSIRACGIAADVTLTDPDSGETSDAVQVQLDHADADAVDIYVPYENAPDGVKFGELVAAEGREPVFSAAP
ncbi:MAG: hypothetical protein QOE69_2417 [Thermoleophilaceae bacterium]|jgi:hypothetical protein|nr:hypothetical protein [Thermoleophilaceae bacterium]MEA2408298.1 hypothetical protein [Thermoleophilaceae bacterium]